MQSLETLDKPLKSPLGQIHGSFHDWALSHASILCPRTEGKERGTWTRDGKWARELGTDVGTGSSRERDRTGSEHYYFLCFASPDNIVFSGSHFFTLIVLTLVQVIGQTARANFKGRRSVLEAGTWLLLLVYFHKCCANVVHNWQNKEFCMSLDEVGL